MTHDADKCPRCGEKLIWCENCYPRFAYCPDTQDCCYESPSSENKDGADIIIPTMLHRIRELEERIEKFRNSLRDIVVACNNARPLSEKIVVIYDIARWEQICAVKLTSQENQNGSVAASAKNGDTNQTENSELASCSLISEEKAVREEESKAATYAPKCSFAVLAHRWGDTQNHTYLVCVVGSEDEAKHWAEREEQDRGGKYSCSIWKCGKVTASHEFTMDDSPMVRDSVDQITKARVIPGGRTVAQNMIDAAKRDKRLKELEDLVEKLQESNNAFVRIAQELELERDMAVKVRNDALDHERKRIAEKDKALKLIASRKIIDEIEADAYSSFDFEGFHTSAVEIAREALKK